MAGKREQIIQAGKNTQFSKDRQPDNPGRKKKIPELDVLLADIMGSEDPDKSEFHAVVESLLKQAKKGNVNAATVLLNRAYGMPKQPNEITGKDGNPLQVDFNVSALSTQEKRALLDLMDKAK